MVFRAALSGEIDLDRLADLQHVVCDFMQDGSADVELDLSRLTFMDSTGLGLLIRLRELACQRGGSVTLLDPTPSSLRILQVTDLGRLFTIEQSQP